MRSGFILPPETTTESDKIFETIVFNTAPRAVKEGDPWEVRNK